MKEISKPQKIIIHLVLFISGISMLLPLVWMFLTSVKTFSEAVEVPPTIFPQNFMWENYTKVLDYLPFLNFFMNTLISIIFRVLFSTLFAAMAAFAVAKLEFKGKNLFFTLVLTQMMIPGQIYLIPQYLLVQRLGLLDTIPALIIPGLVSAFGTFFLRQFFQSLPNELMDAAKIDGATIWQIFFQVYLPLVRSGLIALGIFTAVWSFKDLIWPLIANVSQSKLPLTAGLAALDGQHTTEYPLLMAGSFIAILPMIVLYVLFQKQFIQGIATTGGK